MDARLTRQLLYGLILLFVLGIFSRADAEPQLNIGVAANFAPAMELIGKEYTKKTGIPIQLTISSSGRLFAQIKNRAPFDLYFSADSERPGKLYNEGLCAQPETYAIGRVVLWSGNKDLCKHKKWHDVVQSPAVKKIAMANPSTAPYGTVARQACSKLNDWPEIEQKLVFGTNVVQAFQYAKTGVAQISFVALSIALSEKGNTGCFWEIPESVLVEQMACVMTYSPNVESAKRFLRNITSVDTASLRERFGYN